MTSKKSNSVVPNIDLTEVSVRNREINIDCENYNNNNNGSVLINNGTSNLSNTENETNTRIMNSASAHTLFEASPDNSFRVLRSYREYAAEFINSDESDTVSTGSRSDDISVNDYDYTQSKKNNFDFYRDQSGTNLKNIVYNIEKSKTVNSSSTSSSKTATYKNPTLYSVVNQGYNKSYTSLDKNFFDQQYDDIKKVKKVDKQLKLQKMILNVPETYDIPTRDKKILSQRILNATLVIMIIIATTLLGLYIYLKINQGYSLPHLKDINDDNKIKLIFISLFMYLAVVIGGIGSALNWKSILLTYSIFCTLNALALGYLVYGVYDDAYNQTNLPFAWWDIYSSNTRRVLQDKFSCCGYKNPLDGGEISNYCAKEAVVWNIPYETIYDNFRLLKKDNCRNGLNVTIVKKNKTEDAQNNQTTQTVIIDTNFSSTEVIENNQATPTSSSSSSSSTSSYTSSRTTTSSSRTTTSTYKRSTTTEAKATSTTSKSSTTTRSSSTTSTSSTPTSDSDEKPSSSSSSSDHSKRAFEIEDEETLKIYDSPVIELNIYNILNSKEVEEENDGRDDKEISNIRILNKRTFVQENDDEYQLRTNATNPEINYEKIKASNFTHLTPEESKAYSAANGLVGCEEKLKVFIHSNITPVFKVLLVFFCLYIITIPVALIFLFKLRRIPSINEFE